jgi:hypothetical protein
LYTKQASIKPKIHTCDGRTKVTVGPFNTITSITRLPFYAARFFRTKVFIVLPFEVLGTNLEKAMLRIESSRLR